MPQQITVPYGNISPCGRRHQGRTLGELLNSSLTMKLFSFPGLNRDSNIKELYNYEAFFENLRSPINTKFDLQFIITIDNLEYRLGNN